MDLMAVNSATVSKIGYDIETRIMLVVFNSGSSYEFINVPQEVYNEFQNAKSFGKFFAKKIRPFFVYRKIS